MSRPTIDLLEHQVEFLEDVTTPFIGLVGGYRAGKTVALCYKALKLASINTQADGALLEPVFPMITRTLVPTFNQILHKLNIPFTHNKADAFYDIELIRGQQPKRIWLLSAENFDKAAGMTLSWFGMDEIDRMKVDVADAAWNMMVSRLTTGEFMQGFTTSTPEGYKFMHKFFVEEQGDDRKLIRANTYNNPFISARYFENMKKTHTAKQLEAYFYGHFVNLTTGQVYDQFDRNLNGTTKQVSDFPQHILHLGIDFNIGKMSTTVFIVDKDVPYAVDEFYGSQNTRTLILDIKKRYPTKKIVCYPDCSGVSGSANSDQSSIAMLQEAGFEVKYRRSHPPIDLRIAAVNAKICNSNGVRSFYVNTDKCPRLTKSLEQQGYVDGKPDKGGDIDHPVDGTGYFVEYNWSIKPATGKVSFHRG